MKIALYASVGAELEHYDVDVEAAALTRRGSVVAPANVHYAWPHVSGRILYVASSNGEPGAGIPGDLHRLSAFRIDGENGALSPHGDTVALPSRPIHLTTDIPSNHVLVAFNNPSALRVYRIRPDRSPGGEVAQKERTDPGIYAHQVRVSPDNALAILVARGNDPAAGRPEDPGALKVFHYRDGQLGKEISVAPNGGYGFGPRHLDFHPTRPWVYVSLERQNRLDMFPREDGLIAAAPRFSVTTLAEPQNRRAGQAAGTVHVHPQGRFVYVANRASSTERIEGEEVFAGGENSIAVFAMDGDTGEPSPIEHVDTRGIHPRCFHIDPSGRLLVAAHITALKVREGSRVRAVPACLSVFRIGEDGRLTFARKYDIELGGRSLFWMGMVGF
jgi:6-phosphogluconolactonase (cycloisomerase 2 family)